MPLIDSINKSSQVNRVLTVSFVAVLFFAILSIASVTDLMLFVPESKMKLPIINFELPIVGYFIILPLMILILHYNILVNLRQHCKKILVFEEKGGLKNNVEYEFSPFILNFALNKEKKHIHTLLKILVKIIVFITPILTLTFIQLRFADYHSFGITTLHLLAVILDLLLISIYSNEINKTLSLINKSKRRRTSFMSLKLRIIIGIRRSKRKFSVIRKYLNRPRFGWEKFITLFSVLHFLIFLGVLLSVFSINSRIYFVLESFELIPRLEINGNYIYENSSMNETLKSSNDHKLETLTKVGCYLKERNFTYASFSNCNLSGIQLIKCNISKATFAESNLQKSKLIDCKVNLSSFYNCNFYDSDFIDNLFNSSSFKGSRFSQCVFLGTDFKLCNFYLVDLSESKILHTGHTSRDNLFPSSRGNFFKKCNLENIVLEGTMDASIFSETTIENSDIRDFVCAGCEFNKVSFNKTLFNYVYFCNSSFTNISLDSSEFYRARLGGAIFRNINIGTVVDSLSRTERFPKANERILLLPPERIPISDKGTIFHYKDTTEHDTLFNGYVNNYDFTKEYFSKFAEVYYEYDQNFLLVRLEKKPIHNNMHNFTLIGMLSPQLLHDYTPTEYGMNTLYEVNWNLCSDTILLNYIKKHQATRFLDVSTFLQNRANTLGEKYDGKYQWWFE